MALDQPALVITATATRSAGNSTSTLRAPSMPPACSMVRRPSMSVLRRQPRPTPVSSPEGSRWLANAAATTSGRR